MGQNAKGGNGGATAPFSNEGKPINQGTTSTGGLDVLKSPTGNGDQTPPRPYSEQMPDRRPGNPPPGPMAPPTDPIARGNRPQAAPIDARQRVAPSSIPADGSSHAPVANAPAYRAGTGSVGNTHRPFKFNDGGSKPAAASRASVPSAPAGGAPGSGRTSVFRKVTPGGGR